VDEEGFFLEGKNGMPARVECPAALRLPSSEGPYLSSSATIRTEPRRPSRGMASTNPPALPVLAGVGPGRALPEGVMAPVSSDAALPPSSPVRAFLVLPPSPRIRPGRRGDGGRNAGRLLDLPALREVAGDAAPYFDPHDGCPSHGRWRSSEDGGRDLLEKECRGRRP
jgi:hypothetical protein